ncbi:MAG: PAS domain S-box protein [Ignavibacteriaceae bacterium]
MNSGKLNLKSATKIFIIYLILGGLWITFSDMLLAIAIPDPKLQYQLQTPKGIFFIIVTGLFLYYLIRRDIKIANELYKSEYHSRVAAEKAKSSLEESEKNYKVLFISNPNPMWVYDVETLNFLDVNEAAINNYGYTKEEFLSMTIKDIRPQEDIPDLLANIKTATYGLEHSSGWRHLKKDGSLIYVEIRSNSITYQNRKAKLVSALDITRRKKAEDELQANTEKMKAFFESDLIGILFGDIYGAVLEANDEFLRIIGYSREDLKNGLIRWDKITPKEFYEIDTNRISEAREKGVCTPYEKKYIRKDGSLIWVLVGYILIGPRRENSVAYILDLTKLKEAERKQSELSAQKDELLKILQLQIERMPVGYILTDENFRIKFWNPAAEKIFGYPKDEIINKDPYGMILDEASRKDIDEKRKKWINGKSIVQNINDNITKDGRKIICEWINTPMFDEKGNFKHLLSMVQDITLRIKSEEEIRRQREELRALASHLQSIREKERIAISRELHDELGQILTSVKMNMILMSRELAGNLKQSDVAYFETEMAAMSQLLDKSVKSVRKIITYLRPEVLENLNLIEAIDWQVTEFNKLAGINCKLECNCPDLKLNDDFTTSAFRIVQEALTNVRRHSGADSVTVSILLENDILVLNIKDNGKGIKDLNKIRTESFGLLGIRERAILLGGNMELNSQLGKGTELIVTIPFIESN